MSLFEQAKKFIPGGVNSPVRAFSSVGCDPIFIESANGALVTDTNGKNYIDYVGSWGPMILGHNHPAVKEAVIKAAEKGLSFGACTESETKLAEMICNMLPSFDKVRLVNSGTEATMSAIRLARGVTGRDLIIKFRGCYHGHGDSFLIEAGSGALTFGQPSSPGVTKGTAADTLLADYNDSESVAKLFEKHSGQIAAIIVEGVPGNMGVVPPAPGFLEFLRDQCDANQSLLIMDEVMSGFRVSATGAQGLYNITPDLTTLGKIIGGGMPVGAYGGRADIMDHLSPDGPVYQAGTLSGNPLATAAGIATLTEIQKEGFYQKLAEAAKPWESDLRSLLESSQVPFSLNRVGAMMTLFFKEGGVKNYADASASDTERYALWFRSMLEEGVYLAPSQFEAGFLSAAHTPSDLDKTLTAAEKCVKRLEQEIP